MEFKRKKCENVVETAIKIGYRHIDTAQMYNNKKAVGNGIKNSGISRNDLFVTTKLYSPFTSYDLVIEGVRQSLKNLLLDYIDLVLIHEPYPSAPQMYKALEYLKQNLQKEEIEEVVKNFIMYYNNERLQEKIQELAPIFFFRNFK